MECQAALVVKVQQKSIRVWLYARLWVYVPYSMKNRESRNWISRLANMAMRRMDLFRVTKRNKSVPGVVDSSRLAFDG